jgi:hypothetical protein
MDKLDDLTLDTDLGLDLWQEEFEAEQLPAASALFCFGTFSSVSSVGTCVATAATYLCATCN